jgi:ketosteroid isomerase-like protein
MKISLAASICLAMISAGLSAQTPADSVSVQAFYGRWFGAAAQQGMNAYASFYAADGYILPPNNPPVVGRDSIAAWMQRAREASPYQVRPEGITVNELRFLAADWVVYRSTLRGQRVPKSGGNTVPFETKYVDLLHRTAPDRWEVVFRMWSDNR